VRKEIEEYCGRRIIFVEWWAGKTVQGEGKEKGDGRKDV
jgi:hypothetical protein